VIASVGHRFAELDPVRTLIGSVRFERQGRARIAQDNHGILNVYAATGNGRLLGAELCAPAGEHIAHLLALAIERELTVHELLRLPFYHPVIEEGLRSALRDIARQLPDSTRSDLGFCHHSALRALE
jgi:dihydrolipoamide dehydrogenase